RCAAPPRRHRHHHALHTRAGVAGDPLTAARFGRRGPMIPAQFDYVAPQSVEDALTALAEAGDDAKVLAGGQSLLPILRLRMNTPETIIDLGRIPALREVSEDGDAVVIGAMATHDEVRRHP